MILARIQEYLMLGGLWNPEMMEHDKVRDLIIEARDYIELQEEQINRLKEIIEKRIDMDNALSKI